MNRTRSEPVGQDRSVRLHSDERAIGLVGINQQPQSPAVAPDVQTSCQWHRFASLKTKSAQTKPLQAVKQDKSNWQIGVAGVQPGKPFVRWTKTFPPLAESVHAAGTQPSGSRQFPRRSNPARAPAFGDAGPAGRLGPATLPADLFDPQTFSPTAGDLPPARQSQVLSGRRLRRPARRAQSAQDGHSLPFGQKRRQ